MKTENIMLGLGLCLMLTGFGCATITEWKDHVNVTPPTITVPAVTVTPVTTQPDTPATPIPNASCTCGALGEIVAIPAAMRGGECVLPAGLDIRFDGNYEKLTGKGFSFVGNLLKADCKVSRNADGTYRIALPCTIKQGYKIHVYGYNFPDDKQTIIKGNVCESWSRTGTFRWFVLFYQDDGK